MSQFDLDLDINHYSISDMETFFRLKSNQKYSAEDIEFRESEIREQLFGSGHIHKRLKRDLIAFLTEVKNNLLKSRFPSKSVSKPIKTQDPFPEYPNISYPPSNIRSQEIQTRSSIPYVYTQNSEFLPGVLNPIQTRTLTRCISIDTRFRENPYNTSSSDFMIQIPNKIQKVVSIQLNSMEFSTSSLYNISSSLQNNYLYIRLKTTKTDSEITKVFMIPDGRYTAEGLVAYLNRIFLEDSNFGSLFWDFDPYGSGKVLLDSTDTSVISISLDFSVDSNGNADKNTTDYFCKLGRVLGFTRRKYSNMLPILSETAVDPFIGFSYMFLSLDDFQNNSPPSFISVFQKNNISNSILARIQIQQTNDDNDVSVKFISEPRKYFGPIDMTRMHIKLLDAYGRVVDLNGSDYSFCLLLHIAYDL
jgi:hypothetical protein